MGMTCFEIEIENACKDIGVYFVGIDVGAGRLSYTGAVPARCSGP